MANTTVLDFTFYKGKDPILLQTAYHEASAERAAIEADIQDLEQKIANGTASAGDQTRLQTKKDRKVQLASFTGGFGANIASVERDWKDSEKRRAEEKKKADYDVEKTKAEAEFKTNNPAEAKDAGMTRDQRAVAEYEADVRSGKNSGYGMEGGIKGTLKYLFDVLNPLGIGTIRNNGRLIRGMQRRFTATDLAQGPEVGSEKYIHERGTPGEVVTGTTLDTMVNNAGNLPLLQKKMGVVSNHDPLGTKPAGSVVAAELGGVRDWVNSAREQRNEKFNSGEIGLGAGIGGALGHLSSVGQLAMLAKLFIPESEESKAAKARAALPPTTSSWTPDARRIHSTEIEKLRLKQLEPQLLKLQKERQKFDDAIAGYMRPIFGTSDLTGARDPATVDKDIHQMVVEAEKAGRPLVNDPALKQLAADLGRYAKGDNEDSKSKFKATNTEIQKLIAKRFPDGKFPDAPIFLGGGKASDMGGLYFAVPDETGKGWAIVHSPRGPKGHGKFQRISEKNPLERGVGDLDPEFTEAQYYELPGSGAANAEYRKLHTPSTPGAVEPVYLPDPRPSL